MLGADDALDVFGVPGVGGATGAILTGIFAAPSLGGTGIYDYVANKVSPDYSIWGQVVIQATGVATTLILFVLVYGIVFAFGIYFINRLIARGIRETTPAEHAPRLAAGHATFAPESTP